ncbi:MAG: hypothetical protein LBG44_09720 [Gemmatimonadota bacterium]|jgi:hypothetical protein|nr:hypothetical protein [Gemmatimonadota bacterium]
MTADSSISEIFEDETGARWEAFAPEQTVAHGRQGAVLAFRPAGSGSEGVRSTVTFNSREAAELAIHTLSLRELRRHLGLARVAAGI